MERKCSFTFISFCHSLIVVFVCRFVGRFLPRVSRLQNMGETRKFTNVYVKNLGEDMDDEKLEKMFEKFGEIISVSVSFVTVLMFKLFLCEFAGSKG
jgi:hypothetical protein